MHQIVIRFKSSSLEHISKFINGMPAQAGIQDTLNWIPACAGENYKKETPVHAGVQPEFKSNFRGNF